MSRPTRGWLLDLAVIVLVTVTNEGSPTDAILFRLCPYLFNRFTMADPATQTFDSLKLHPDLQKGIQGLTPSVMILSLGQCCTGWGFGWRLVILRRSGMPYPLSCHSQGCPLGMSYFSFC